MEEPVNDEAEVLEALRRLVERIQRSDYRDVLGHPLKMSAALRDAVALLEQHESGPSHSGE